VHEPVEPIVNIFGLLFGDKVHEPFFDHVLTPGEFDVAIVDRLFTLPTVKDDTLHVTVVNVAAVTGPEVTAPNKAATTNSTTTARPRTKLNINHILQTTLRLNIQDL